MSEDDSEHVEMGIPLRLWMMIPMVVVVGGIWLLTEVPYGWAVIGLMFIALTGMFTAWVVLGVREGWRPMP
jgi:hypothetical protein